MLWVGIDVGGTFTDGVAYDDQLGRFRFAKAASTPDAPTRGVMSVLDMLGCDPADIARFCHGVTIGTNAILERKGAEVWMLTTRGHRDVLEIGRTNRPVLYDLRTLKPKPLVPRARTLEITERLMWDAFTPEIRSEIEAKGVWHRPSAYAIEPTPVTKRLIEDGRKHLLFGRGFEVGCPVHILQGAQDPDVPWKHAFALAHRLPAEDMVLTMIQDGDHRLSRPQDIARILSAVAEMG